MNKNSVLNFPWEEEHYYFKNHYRLKFFEMILEDITPGCLLDCGSGGASLLKAMALKGWKCYGFDGRLVVDPLTMPPNVLLESFELRIENTELPFPGVVFDVVTASGFVDYLDSFTGFFGQVARRLNSNGSFLFSAINGHHQNSRKNPGHKEWRLHYPEAITACLLVNFNNVYLFPIEEVNSQHNERERDILIRAYQAKVQINSPDETRQLAMKSDNIQQFTFLAQSVKSK